MSRLGRGIAALALLGAAALAGCGGPSYPAVWVKRGERAEKGFRHVRIEDHGFLLSPEQERDMRACFKDLEEVLPRPREWEREMWFIVLCMESKGYEGLRF